LGVNYALILGLITAIFDLVPIIGPAVAFVIILLAVSKLGALKIGLAILIFAFAQWAENNLIRPYVFGKLLNIHPLIIFFFILVTAQFLGIVGLIFAPAIAATVCVLVEELYIKNIN
jgi:predicted PurR-regulated permease PerM